MANAVATRKLDSKKPFTVVIEGNIGSGKTTFLNYFKKYNNICVLAEPVEMWRNCAGHNLLAHMYEDRTRWGFTFQSYVQLTMLQQHTIETPHPIKLMERSIYSARYCFVEKMYRDGLLPAPSASVLDEWFKWVTSKADTAIDLIGKTYFLALGHIHNSSAKAHMYEDRTRWGFTFQSYVQLTMLQQHTIETPHPIKLMERSIYSARYCFVEKMYRDGLLPAPSASVLDEWFKWVTSKADTAIDLIVYLRTSPEVVHQRMLARNRQEERSVSLEYLKELHEMHENWLYHKTMFTCPAPVITLNADLDKSVITEEYEKYEPLILNKIAVEA